MTSVNNTIDKFGRRRRTGWNGSTVGVRGPAGVGFKLDSAGNYDMKSKRLTKVGEPVNNSDAATQNYVSNRINITVKSIEAAVQQSSSMIVDRVYKHMDEKIEVVKSLISKNQEVVHVEIKKIEDILSWKIKKIEGDFLRKLKKLEEKNTSVSSHPNEERLAFPPELLPEIEA